MANPRFERTGALSIEYRYAREGPNSYLIWEAPGRSYICMTGKDVIKQTKWTKGTETGAALRAWIDEIEQPGHTSENALTSSGN